MQYPGFPNNRLIVGGVDLTEEFKMVLVDGYVLEPPEPKTYTVDIPGGNGVIDLTEVIFGDVTYSNRNQSFTFYVIKPTNFEHLKTSVSNFLHGKEFDYKITMDPLYTYHGRFTITGYEHEMYEIGIAGIIKVNISANPYKYKDPVIKSFNAISGIQLNFDSGRKNVCPTIEVENPCTVIFKGKQYELKPGTWKINDLMFTSGSNSVYFNNYQVRNITWNDLNNNGVTWGRLKTKAIFEWYKSRGSAQVPIKTWGDVSTDTWQSHIDLNETWDDQMMDTNVKSLKPVYIKYEWGDL